MRDQTVQRPQKELARFDRFSEGRCMNYPDTGRSHFRPGSVVLDRCCAIGGRSSKFRFEISNELLTTLIFTLLLALLLRAWHL